jgi:hypothetical protein
VFLKKKINKNNFEKKMKRRRRRRRQFWKKKSKKQMKKMEKHVGKVKAILSTNSIFFLKNLQR